jgi:hypothetical protein
MIQHSTPLFMKILAFDVFTDFVLAVMLAWVISTLNLQKKVKFGLIILICLGVLWVLTFDYRGTGN